MFETTSLCANMISIKYNYLYYKAIIETIRVKNPKSANVAEGDPKAPYSITTTQV